MRKVRAGLSFVAFAVIIVFALGYFTSMGVAVRRPPQRTNISLQVSDINGLVVGSSVQLRGVPIGEISTITTTITGATINLYVDSRYKIPVDSNVRLENLSALGEAYIELVPHSEGGPMWQDGQRIATAAITQPPSISELAASVVRVLNQLDPGALDRIINETDTALPNPTTVLPNLSHAATLLRNTAATMNGKGRDLLDNFQALFRNADFVGPVLAFNAPYITRISHYIADATSCVIEGYNTGGPQTIKNFAHFVARIEHLLDHSSGDIKILMQSMLPYLNDISGALMNLDTSQVFANMLAALPEDGAVTLHVTIPDTGGPDSAAAGAPTTPAAPATTTPAAPAPENALARPSATPAPHVDAAPRTGAPAALGPPESLLPLHACSPVLPTATTPAPHADATPRAGAHAIPVPAAPGN
jgi:phospholipid/cholesterol/gamma-HCH transport system substrate-binding protein